MNPQGCVWQQGSFSEHFFIPDGPPAPYLLDSVSEAHRQCEWHKQAQYHHGESLLRRGTDGSGILGYIVALC